MHGGTTTVNRTLHPDRKGSQRERILTAMIDVVARDGYAATTIAQVIAAGGVSRPTFYDYFKDKDDCFLACLAEIQQQLLAETRQAVESEAPEHATAATIRSLVAFADSKRELAHVMMNEAMAGGPRALDLRDQGIVDVAQVLEQAHERVTAKKPTPDISPLLLIGTIHRLLAARLRHDEHDLAWMVKELMRWAERYEEPAGKHRWRTLTPVADPAPWPILPESMLRAPAPLEPAQGRRDEVRENRRRRILFATAEVGREKGYTAVTVADIIKRAGVDRRAFNALFADKQAAFEAAHELGFQRTIALTAGAYFTGATWPERIWEAGRGFTQYFQGNLTIAHIGFVESTAVGPDAIKRLEDSVNAFTIFFQDGKEYLPAGSPAPEPLALEAIATAVMEMGYRECRREDEHQMENLLPHVSFLCLAPFMGASAANRFIDERLETKAQTSP
jgi:AcrR family transcriptional regulator